MPQQQVVILTSEDRKILQTFFHRGKANARTPAHSHAHASSSNQRMDKAQQPWRPPSMCARCQSRTYDSISPDIILWMLKKTNSNPGSPIGFVKALVYLAHNSARQA